jgi:hypothetical protein
MRECPRSELSCLVREDCHDERRFGGRIVCPRFPLIRFGSARGEREFPILDSVMASVNDVPLAWYKCESWGRAECVMFDVGPCAIGDDPCEADDADFVPSFGTIRVCQHCGRLIASGPFVCACRSRVLHRGPVMRHACHFRVAVNVMGESSAVEALLK